MDNFIFFMPNTGGFSVRWNPHPTDNTPGENILCLKRIWDWCCTQRDCGAQLVEPRMGSSQRTPGEAALGCLGLLRRAGAPMGMAFGGAHPPGCNSQISNGIVFLKSRWRWGSQRFMACGDPELSTTSSFWRLGLHCSPNTSTATSPTTQPWLFLQTETFHGTAAISRGQKGPLLTLSPNLSKELIFRAILPQQSKFWFMSWGDGWAPLTRERGSFGWMGSVPGGASTAGAATISSSLGNSNLPYFLH